MTDDERAERGPSHGFVVASAILLADRHRVVWSWRRWRRVCRCGADLPCRAWYRIPVNRGHWSDGPVRRVPWSDRPARGGAVPERRWGRDER